MKALCVDDSSSAVASTVPKYINVTNVCEYTHITLGLGLTSLELKMKLGEFIQLVSWYLYLDPTWIPKKSVVRSDYWSSVTFRGYKGIKASEDV